MNAQQVMAGLGWSALATVLTTACQFVFMAVLARLLDPAAFGLMAMAAIALRFASFFSQMGFAQAIIQRQQLAAEDTTAALLMALGLGSVLYAGVALGAPLFAEGFRAPELRAIMAVLGLSLLLSSLGGLPTALLRRQARFKRVNAIEVASFLAGYGAVGIVCANLGLGVWSLVAATLSQQLLTILLGFMAVSYPLTWPVPRAAFAGLWAYGSRYSLIGFLEFLSANVESLFIGRALGKVELGYFNRAITLTNLPVELGVNAVNKVLFPALAGMQGDRGKMADGFQMLLLSIGLFSTAMACGIAAAAPDLVALLLGAKWLTITPIVSIVAFAVPPMFMFVACGVTLDSMAALAPKLRLQTVILLGKGVAVLLLARWGVPGIACAVVLAEMARLLLGIRLVAALLSINASRLWWQAALLVVLGLVVFTAVAAALSLGHAVRLPLLGRVLLETLAGMASLVCCVLLLAVRCPGYAPLRRFETVRLWHGRLMHMLNVRAVYP
jgi:O-antigen/teichoic acid export membrane protein